MPMSTWNHGSFSSMGIALVLQVGPRLTAHRALDRVQTLALRGGPVTTDDFSPVGSIAAKSPAGQHLVGLGVDPVVFTSNGILARLPVTAREDDGPSWTRVCWGRTTPGVASLCTEQSER